MSDWRPGHDPIHELPLGTPINAYGETLVDLPFFRRPTAGDLEWIGDQGLKGTRATIALLNRLTLIPTPTLRAMDAYDLGRADDVLDHFLHRGPTAKIASTLSRSSGESSPE